MSRASPRIVRLFLFASVLVSGASFAVTARADCTKDDECKGNRICVQGTCCPSGFPICCANSSWCGTNAAACQQEVDNPGAPPGGSNNSSATGSGSGTGSGGGGQTVCSSEPTPCGTLQFCAASDGSQCYFSFNGSTFPCDSCADADGACSTNAQNAIAQACGG